MASWAAAGVVREIREVLPGRIRRQVGKGARAVGTVSDLQAGKAAPTVGRTLTAPTLAINGRHRGRVVDTRGLPLMVMKPNSLRVFAAGQHRRTERMVHEQTGKWSFLTGYARVLIVVARDPALRLRDIAAACHITERTAQNIVTGLEQAGYLRRERAGRRTRYNVCPDGTLRHPTESHLPVRALVELFTRHDGKR
ncbi:MarR family transcriptional regulator [Streptomyces kaempferi]|uniref:MarR family transcriptional regulator n=1 Tax=Streptomyces kaempferi TaxID=333725 RepID=A0ABW3XT89_9ACTN